MKSNITDDRKKYLKNIQKQSYLLGKNKKILKTCVKLIKKTDNYDYTYLWTWLGAPIIQLPADILVTQEIIYKVKPDIIIETGVARGGSLIFYSSILKLIKKNFKVFGIDIDIRPHNKKTIQQSKLSKYITLFQGSSLDKNLVEKIKKKIKKKDKILVILDSNHTREHVLKECNIYSELVSKNSYMIVADTTAGFMSNGQMPKKRSIILKKGDEPYTAIKYFLKKNKKFKIDENLNGKLIFSSNYNGYLIKK
jgi:cephalosporin hydroxylase